MYIPCSVAQGLGEIFRYLCFCMSDEKLWADLIT